MRRSGPPRRRLKLLQRRLDAGTPLYSRASRGAADIVQRQWECPPEKCAPKHGGWGPQSINCKYPASANSGNDSCSNSAIRSRQKIRFDRLHQGRCVSPVSIAILHAAENVVADHKREHSEPREVAARRTDSSRATATSMPPLTAAANEFGQNVAPV